jgi:photosystem II stability/assembly factor-like uncharacterized protein
MAVSFADASTGWAVGYGGMIVRTTNGGATWTQVAETLTSEDLRGVSAPTAGTCWVVGANGTIYSWAGLVWLDQSPGGGTLHGVAFSDAQNGVAVGASTRILSTSNGGATWQNRTPPGAPSGELYDVTLVAGRAWAAGTDWSESVIYSASDLTTWVRQTAPGTMVFAVAAFDAGHAAGGGAVITTANGGGTWTQQGGGTTRDLQSVAFVDRLQGWAVGGDGGSAKVLATVDGGATWQDRTPEPVTGPYNWFGNVAFVSAARGWVVGWGGCILRTEDGGSTWIQQAAPTSGLPNLVGIAAVDDQHVWAVGHLGGVRHTSDGGSTWFAQTAAPGAGLRDVAAVDASHAWLVGDSGSEAVIRVTSNGGTTWTPQSPPPVLSSTAFNGIDFVNGSMGWAVGDGGAIIATSDGGAHWVQQTSGVTADLDDVDFVDAAHGWAVGDGGVILATGDGGAHWTLSGRGTATWLHRVCALDTTHAWISGSEGALLALDVVAPVTTPTAASGWQKAPVEVGLSATDAQSGVARTDYRLDGGAWIGGTLASVTLNGSHVLEYRSTDVVGNVETAGSVPVRIDMVKPRTAALANATVKKGKYVKLRYKLVDSVAPQCTVKLQILRKGKVVKTVACGKRSPGALVFRWKCTVRRGTYTYRFTATDLAGNKQVKMAGKRLTVR